MTTTSQEVSEKIAEFLGEDAPKPIDGEYYKYSIEDILSRPFCKAIAKKKNLMVNDAWYWSGMLATEFYNGGFPAVEGRLLELMNGGGK